LSFFSNYLDKKRGSEDPLEEKYKPNGSHEVLNLYSSVVYV